MLRPRSVDCGSNADPRGVSCGFASTSWAVSSTETSEGLTTKAIQAWPFARVRESRNIARTLILLPVASNTEMARLHLSAWNSIHEASLLNGILDMLKKTDSLNALSAVHVACLYRLRRALSSETIGPSKIAVQGTMLHDAGSVVWRILTVFHD
jgi:hypothetical protein